MKKKSKEKQTNKRVQWNCEKKKYTIHGICSKYDKVHYDQLLFITLFSRHSDIRVQRGVNKNNKIVYNTIYFIFFDYSLMHTHR